ncbi:unnamed protein product [Blepharisma stoltei]|uniref:Kinesin-like protein n=1 Tax=Blepharisma stoltei TaxID=1481888 RepID=A0AAU9JIC5_9CILI|nr:unnamed protein product [Blepharisma stoltei]
MFLRERESLTHASTNFLNSEKENFKVAIRVRPPLEREIDPAYGFSSIAKVGNDQNTITLLDYLGSATNDMAREQDIYENPALCNYHTYTFDHVYDQNATQVEVYETTARPAVSSILEGYNATLLAYGQTGTGKTYTMEGFKYDSNDSQRGIIPRAVEDIFKFIESTDNSNCKFMVRASYLQIYNENISDLLKNDRVSLQIREEKRKGVFVEGLSEWAVRSPSEICSLMQKGELARATACTKMNDMSSRSHAVFILIVEQLTSVEESTEIKVGKLNIVDLAGSERVRVTGATGKRLEESKKINQSLSALGNVIAALIDTKNRSHVPYRDSKLTRLLEDSLGGNCKTTMMAMISPAFESFSESLSTIKFANRAKNIKNAPKINEDVDQRTLLRKYEIELQKLRIALEEKSQGVIDMQKLMELEEEMRNCEADKEAAIEALERRSREYLQEKEEKNKLEELIKKMDSQMLIGGKKIEDTPQFRTALEEKHREMREEYDNRMREIEKEREMIEQDKAQIDRYKQLLLRQRDIMIALTARLNERDETIIQLQEDLDTFDKIQKEYENSLQNKNSRIEQLDMILKAHGIEVPEDFMVPDIVQEKEPRKYQPYSTNEINIDQDYHFPLQMLTAEEKINELSQLIVEKTKEIEALHRNFSKFEEPKEQIDTIKIKGLIKNGILMKLDSLKAGIDINKEEYGEINDILKGVYDTCWSTLAYLGDIKEQDKPKENLAPNTKETAINRARALTVDEILSIKRQEMRKNLKQIQPNNY